MISQKDRKMYKDYAQDYNQELANEFWHLVYILVRKTSFYFPLKPFGILLLVY